MERSTQTYWTLEALEIVIARACVRACVCVCVFGCTLALKVNIFPSGLIQYTWKVPLYRSSGRSLYIVSK